jgi:hypothetical protein
VADFRRHEDRVIAAEDRALIERVRMVNKTLSIFVFAIQEGGAEGHIEIADALVALADTIRDRRPDRIVPVQCLTTRSRSSSSSPGGVAMLNNPADSPPDGQRA